MVDRHRTIPSTCQTCGRDFVALNSSAAKYCSVACSGEKPKSDMLASELEIAWLAGLLEGEGTFNITDLGGIRVSIEMTDLDILQRIQRALGFGSIGKPRARGTNKQIWTFSVSSRLDVEQLLIAILPYMGERRSKKIGLMLGYIKLIKRRQESA